VTRRSEHGFVAAEWVAAVAVLLLPALLLVASLPVWAERRHVGVVAAREAAAALVRDVPVLDAPRATLVAKVVAANHGVDPGDVAVDVRGGAGRGQVLTVVVRVRMPAIAVPGLGGVAAWTHTVEQHRRVDDYHSR
jgi:hypothetical protein